MEDPKNQILPDHQDILLDQFNHITYLINNGKLSDAAEHLLDLHYADLADYLDTANRKMYHVILPAIANRMDPETIAFLSNGNKQHVLKALGLKKSASIIDVLDIEDAINVIDSLSEDLKASIISSLNEEKRKQILEGFQYPEGTAGRILEKGFVSFHQHWTVGQAIDFIRRTHHNSDFHAAIIVSPRFKPIGTILLSTLLKNPRNSLISDLMNKEFKVVDTQAELDDLAFIFKQYALTIVPVTNKQGKLVGSISINNMIYIIESEAENDLMQLGGIQDHDIFRDLYATVKHRLPWLFVNLITAFITSMFINQFDHTIAKLVILAVIMPIVAAMGGSSGTQVMTVTVRALASREINNSNMMRVIFKEVLVCSLSGLLFAAASFLLIYLIFSNVALGIIFSSSIIINFVMSGLLGSAIPICLNNLKIDPAAASGVFLITFTDAIGYCSFLGLAYFFLV